VHSRRVMLTGMGVVTPLGSTLTEFWRALKGGDCGLRPVKHLLPARLSPVVGGSVQDFDPLDFFPSPTPSK
jgi:3-oxoacyl-(acyl-carrier-protein) synthase